MNKSIVQNGNPTTLIPQTDKQGITKSHVLLVIGVYMLLIDDNCLVKLIFSDMHKGYDES